MGDYIALHARIDFGCSLIKINLKNFTYHKLRRESSIQNLLKTRRITIGYSLELLNIRSQLK